MFKDLVGDAVLGQLLAFERAGGTPVSPIHIYRALPSQPSRSTVRQAIKQLRADGLVSADARYRLSLTDTGRRRAVTIPAHYYANVAGARAAKMRRCLSCGQSMHSSWAGHRICDGCKRSDPWQSGAFVGV